MLNQKCKIFLESVQAKTMSRYIFFLVSCSLVKHSVPYAGGVVLGPAASTTITVNAPPGMPPPASIALAPQPQPGKFYVYVYI